MRTRPQRLLQKPAATPESEGRFERLYHALALEHCAANNELRSLHLELLTLCYAIEELPPGEQQTAVSIRASNLAHRVQALVRPSLHGRATPWK